MKHIIVPIIHHNGDRASTIIASLEHSYDTCRTALVALDSCAGNARNFYPEAGRWEKYCAQHHERQQHINAVIESLIAELEAIQAQPEAQRQLARH